MIGFGFFFGWLPSVLFSTTVDVANLMLFGFCIGFILPPFIGMWLDSLVDKKIWELPN